MSIDVLARSGCAPMIVSDVFWFPRILGCHVNAEHVDLEVLDPEDRPVLIPLPEDTFQELRHSRLVCYVFLSEDDQIASARLCRMNGSADKGTPLSEVELKVRAEEIVAREFVRTFVDIAKAGWPDINLRWLQ